MYVGLRISKKIINNDQSLDDAALVNKRLGSGSLSGDGESTRRKMEERRCDVFMCSARGVAMLEGVALLEWAWSCWSRCGPVGVGVALWAWTLRHSS